MHIESMRYFVELADTGSFNSAARNLFISPQGLNKAVSVIEKEFGTKLVERTRHGVTLTPAGRVFYDHALVVVREIGAMVDDMAQAASEEFEQEDPLQVTTSSYALAVLVGISSLSTALRNISLHEEQIDEILQSVMTASNNELFLTELYPETERRLELEKKLTFEPILSTQTGVIWRKGFELENKHALHRSDLTNIPIAYNAHRDMRVWTEHLFKDVPLQNVQLKTSSIRLLVEFAHKEFVSLFDSYGYHVAMGDTSVRTDGLKFTPLATPDARIKVGFLYRKDNRPNARCRRTIEMTKRVFASLNPDYIRQNSLD